MIPILRAELIRPESLGCSHIKHLLQDPASFKIRGQLVEGFVVAFFNLMWGVPVNTIAPPALALARNKVKLQVMHGPHTEGAILHVDSSACSPNFVPMIVPEFQKVSIGVSHSDAVRQLREISARFLNDQAKKIGITHAATTDAEYEAKLHESMDKLAATQFLQAQLMDKGKTPVYTLKYPPECCMGKV